MNKPDTNPNTNPSQYQFQVIGEHTKECLQSTEKNRLLFGALNVNTILELDCTQKFLGSPTTILLGNGDCPQKH